MLRGVSKGRVPFGSGRLGRRAAARPIARPGLLARLDAAPGIVVLTGGAGAGKSTLLDAWSGATADDVTAADVDDVLRRHHGQKLVLATAEDLAIPGSVQVRADELAFAEDETYQVLAAAFADAEAADVLAPDLHLLTNGWPGLVALTAAWLAQHPAHERRARLLTLTRCEAELADYLVPAVVAGLSGAERELVRRLAHLPGIDARLADRLDITEDLRAIPPFVQELLRRPGWFVVPEGWKAALRAELPLSAAEYSRLRDAYFA
ncbi:P-loop NTPase family protein [Dactylosporangium matsuzakiense]|uniref:Uncharacterized protein n=1 Tax=Dactylosporangium matsuzakiense TaxID=53360 RepID=A0A9W6KC68_9ACTN|nr:hypothetical protein [Dactylosporangium matsuzakiense]UWZ45216.1 hypothetical protein Dmats_01245 [Dactylosporangium matsuzakiense]GLK98822.1 hypothetical protein GCM10017581_005630 [Dactylosporangium matsuzakiense]